MKFDALKKQCLVIDIETSAHFHGGKEIDIKQDFETYLLMAGSFYHPFADVVFG